MDGRPHDRPPRAPAAVAPRWAPDSSRFAFRHPEGLGVCCLTGGGALLAARVPDGVSTAMWSPDGRWLVYADTGGSLWIVADDGHAGPTRLGTAVSWPPAPTWAPTSDRIAATVVGDDGTRRLTVFSLGAGTG